MTTCRICGAVLPGEGARCGYAVPLEHAPGIGDPGKIAAGSMSHDDHEVQIARWRVHHPDARGATAAVMAWARERLAREGHIVPTS